MLGTEHLPKWLLYSATSSFLCILGSFMVPIVYASFSSHREVNTKLLNYGLSLSAGSMLCTSLLKMLGSTEQANSAIVFVGFSAGCLISFILNYIVHSYTSQSLIHCAHSNEGGELISDNFDDSHLYDMQTHAHRLSHSHSHGHSNNGFGASEVENDVPDPQHTHNHSHHHETLPEHEEETTPLINHSEHEPIICATVKPKPSTSLSEYHNANDCIPVVRSATISSLPLAKCGSETKPPAMCIEPNIGYDLENLAVYREQFMSKGDSTMDSLSDHGTVLHENDHRHVMETPFSKLLSIGIQTCMVICLHKFPEGFIIFYTNPPDKVSDGKPDIGFSIFLSLAVHNFIEGFAMTLPLFTALETKWHALLITVILGGGSQPLGALLGLEWYKHSSPDLSPEYATEKMDFLLSITSGFLFVISLQMFQTAVAFSDTHHHHEGEDNSTIREHHSAGTTCLKFCCVGVLLILASSALQTL